VKKYCSIIAIGLYATRSGSYISLKVELLAGELGMSWEPTTKVGFGK